LQHQLGPDHIPPAPGYLFRERKLKPNTVTQHLGGIRFFYIKTLRQSGSADLTPYPKKLLRLPSILSREEVNSLIEAAPTPFQRTLLMALYATDKRSVTKHSMASLAFRQYVDNFRGCGSSAMLFDDLAEEYYALAVDQECRRISRFVRRVPT
jgi:integrase/recombinase XerD